jgi:nitrate reductase NapE component
VTEVEKGSRLTSIERNNTIILLVLTLGSLCCKSHTVTLGVLLGGVIVILNFWLLRRIVEGGLRKSKNRPALVMSYFLKFAALVAVIFWVIYSGIVDTLGFVVGLSTVFIGIALDGFVQVLKKS